MDLSTVVPYLVPTATAFSVVMGVIIKSQRPTQRRDNLKSDIEMLKDVAEGSAAHVQLQEHIDWQVTELKRFEQLAKREWGVGITALLAAMALTGATAALAAEGGWWLLGILITGPLAFVMAWGAGDSFTKTERSQRAADKEKAASEGAG